MLRPILSHAGAQVKDALFPTALALLWCTALVIFKRHTLKQKHSSEESAVSIDLDQTWKDLEWASYRIIASLSTVTGLLLAFRSNSAIDRWSTARRKWSDVQATSRSLLRLLSASLLYDSERLSPDSLDAFAEKQSSKAKVDATIATIPFFSISLMYEMRGRSLELTPGRRSLLRSDLVDVLPPKLLAATTYQQASSPTERTAKEQEQKKGKQMVNVDSPHIIRPLTHSTRNSTNLALSALVLLQQSIDSFHRSEMLSSPVYAHSIGLINSLSSHMTELERIRDTPIPLSVSRHFSRLLAIHTTLLPILVTQRLHERLWLGLLIVGVVTSMLYGVDSFAATLGQPFGLDREDLPLEKYVADAQREWDEIRSACTSNNQE